MEQKEIGPSEFWPGAKYSLYLFKYKIKIIPDLYLTEKAFFLTNSIDKMIIFDD